MNTPLDIISVFEALCMDHKLINSFERGDYDDILSAQMDRVEYPLLWVESPEIRIDGNNDGNRDVAYVTFVVLSHSSLEDRPWSLFNQELCYKIARSVVAKLLELYEDMEISDIKLSFLSHHNGDNNQGYRVEMKIPMEMVCDSYSDLFVGSEMLDVIPSFSWTRIGTEIECTSNNLDYDINWKWKSDSEHDVSGLDELLLEDKGDPLFYIEMSWSQGGHMRSCSAMIDNTEDGSGESVAILYNALK